MSRDPMPGHVHSHHRPSWPTQPRERAAWAVALLLALATLAGLLVLWPYGDVSATSTAGVDADRYRARVVAATLGPCSYATADDPAECLTVEVQPSQGPDAGQVVSLGEFDVATSLVPDLDVGDRVVVAYEASTGRYSFADRERRSTLWWLALLFVIVVLVVGRSKGAVALGALAATVVILVAFVVPAVLDGRSPLAVALVAAGAIAFVSLYLTHGVNLMTTAAVLGTFAALGVTVLLATLFFELAQFSGAASEEALLLPLLAERVDLGGLVLGGMVIGALGALDDVVVTQAATVWELRRVEPRLSSHAVFTSAMRVGREHIGSIINTLLLAYAGASMPLLLLFTVAAESLGTVANSEVVAVEIVRTLVGSIGLVLAVPFTTWLAAFLTHRPRPEPRAA